MPIYEYICEGCGAKFEALRPLNDTGESLACPECGGSRLEKVFSTFAASSSGSGHENACPTASSCSVGSQFG